MKKNKLILKERDHIILKHIYDYRFLSGELLWYLLKSEDQIDSIIYSTGKDGRNRPKRYGFKQQTLSKRLKQLYDAKYVERHYMTDQAYGRGYGSPRAIYGLGKQSSKLLQERYKIPQYITRKILESNKVKSPFLRHALELATFRVILKLACLKSKGKVKLLFWEQGNCIKDYVYGFYDKGDKERFTVYADAFFGLEIRDTGKRHFFLEIDRGTEPIVSNRQRTDIKGKILGFQYYRKSKSFLNRYSYNKLPNGQIVGLNIHDDANPIEVIESNRISGYQVLFVVSGKIVENESITVYGRIANILNALLSFGKLYKTTTIFWFVSPTSLRLDSPENIFHHIWVTSKLDSPLKSLID